MYAQQALWRTFAACINARAPAFLATGLRVLSGVGSSVGSGVGLTVVGCGVGLAVVGRGVGCGVFGPMKFHTCQNALR